jgi:hypothetical protein
LYDPAPTVSRNCIARLITLSSTTMSLPSCAALSAWTCQPTIDVSPVVPAW